MYFWNLTIPGGGLPEKGDTGVIETSLGTKYPKQTNWWH